MTVTRPIAFIILSFFAFGFVIMVFMIFDAIFERVKNKRIRRQAEMNDIQDNLDRLKVHVDGEILDINRKLRVIEDKFRVMEQMEFIEKVKKICDEETFSYEVFNSIENRYADIKIFSKELDTSFLLEISKICDYDLRERTENSIIMRVCLKGE